MNLEIQAEVLRKLEKPRKESVGQIRALLDGKDTNNVIPRQIKDEVAEKVGTSLIYATVCEENCKDKEVIMRFLHIATKSIIDAVELMVDEIKVQADMQKWVNVLSNKENK